MHFWESINQSQLPLFTFCSSGVLAFGQSWSSLLWKKSLKKLQLDFVDLFIMHYPVPMKVVISLSKEYMFSWGCGYHFSGWLRQVSIIISYEFMVINI